MSENSLLDRIDREIVGHLQKDARLSNKELAARVGLAPSSCLVRTQRLIERGVLLGFHARVDPRALGVSLQAMVFVQLQSHGGSTIRQFAEFVVSLPEVSELYHVGGSQDLLIHVATRDTDHLREVVMDQLSAREEVRHIETSIIFEHRRSPV